MKHLAPILFLAFSTLAHGNELTVLSDLASLQWKNRIVIINEAEDEQGILTLLNKYTAGIDERDIIWFIFTQARVLTNFPGKLSEDFSNRTHERYDNVQSKAVLIGKDGGIKSRYHRVDLEAVFSDIDVMPMRQYEMRN